MKRACRGFSLLEVLVAFIILSLALGVLMRIFSGGLGNIGAAEQYSRAVAIAESRLAVVGVEAPLEAGQSAGEAENGYRWQTTVQRFDSGTAPVENAAEALSLYRVEVLVNWDDEATTARGIRLVSLRAAAAP
jgi:general secretion pathway protein I